MTMQQILYALETAGCGSISSAAERLYISQSALSQQIHRLEKELGYDLFVRNNQGLSLTPEGEAFCEQARSVAEAWSSFTRQVQRPGGGGRHLRIGVGSRVFSNGLFPRIVAYFEERPELEISFITEAGRDFLTALRQKSLDMALDVLPSEDYVSEHSEYMSLPLIREVQCILMARENPLAGKKTLRYKDLEGSTMISGLEQSSEARILREMVKKHDVHLKRMYRSDGIDTVMRLVKGGKGLILGPRSFAEYFGVAAVPLSPRVEASLQFICLKERASRREIAEFRSFLQSETLRR
ncbi:MAG: LysR family transcriptional regulator [Lachnospiraceae bacterium]|nr:LysR family transcriptional regulator [Lachnospiraceae bacterium]